MRPLTDDPKLVCKRRIDWVYPALRAGDLFVAIRGEKKQDGHDFALPKRSTMAQWRPSLYNPR